METRSGRRRGPRAESRSPSLQYGLVQRRDSEASTAALARRRLGRSGIVVVGEVVRNIRELCGRKATLATHARNLSSCIEPR